MTPAPVRASLGRVELVTLLLLLGLAGLYAAHRKALRRLTRLERQLEQLVHASAPPPPPAEPVPATEETRREWMPPPRPPAEEAPSSAEPAPVKETLAALFERFVGGRLLIWIGGIALAVAGVFLVRYSIEIGLVTPPVRMMMAAAFGLALVGAGELARRRAGVAPDPRIAQALVGAGILVLYATPYGAHVLYGLIGIAAASTLMALVTAAALILSLRHGAPTAVLGLAGGFLTPLLVGDPDAGAVPLLAYLALLNAGLFALAGRRGWSWIAAAAVALSFAWTGLLMLDPDASDALAGGVFIVILAVASSLLRPGEGRQLQLPWPAALGLVQLAFLVARANVGLPAWALFGTLAAASLYLSTRRAEFRLLPALALALALVLLATETALRTEPMAPRNRRRAT